MCVANNYMFYLWSGIKSDFCLNVRCLSLVLSKKPRQILDRNHSAPGGENSLIKIFKSNSTCSTTIMAYEWTTSLWILTSTCSQAHVRIESAPFGCRCLSPFSKRCSRYYRCISESIVPNANFSSSNKPGGVSEFKESFLIVIKPLRLHKPQL